MTNVVASAFALSLGAALIPARADETLKSRLQDQHAEGQEQWIYNDLAAGFAEAKRSGKPLFVTFRCVPCADCKGFDAEVAGGGDADFQKLVREKFVAVRQVEMKGVDLSQFQFDYDLNWAAMFLNADGTVYGRYGTQSVEGPDAYNSMESLIMTMERVLDLHQEFPAIKPLLAKKKGEPKPYKSALEMPGLPNKDQFRKTTERGNCIHCHNIHDAETLGAWDAGTYSRDMLWRYPLPENIGLTIDPTNGRRIKSVQEGGTLAKSGVQAGDVVAEIDGQSITSIADIQWALHRLPKEQDSIQIVIESPPGTRNRHQFPLAPGWRRTDLSWRGSMWSVPPRLRIWLPEPNEKEREQHKLPAGQSAVVARWINTKEEAGRLASEAGLQTGDLIIELDGKPVPGGGGAVFSTLVKLNYEPGQKLPLTVWRGGKRVKIEVPLVK